MRVLFDDDFPKINSSAELEKAKLDYAKLGYDEYYVVSGCTEDRRKLFEKLWQVYEPYCDKHFLGQHKRDFHARTWEMYLGNVFLQNGFTISCLDDGPDLKLGPLKPPIWIEATAPKKGQGADAVPAMAYGLVVDIPDDQMLLRLTQSLSEKFRKYQEYLRKGIVSKNDPFVIAVNRGMLDHTDTYMPLIFKCLFSLGELTMPIDIETHEVGESYISRRETIQKKNGQQVPLGFFEDASHSGISAVIYSTRTVLNHPAKLGKDCIVVHNPLAANPLPKDSFSFLNQWALSGGQIKQIGHEPIQTS